MDILFILLALVSGYFLGVNKKSHKEYNHYKKTNGLYEPVKRS